MIGGFSNNLAAWVRLPAATGSWYEAWWSANAKFLCSIGTTGATGTAARWKTWWRSSYAADPAAVAINSAAGMMAHYDSLHKLLVLSRQQVHACTGNILWIPEVGKVRVQTFVLSDRNEIDFFCGGISFEVKDSAFPDRVLISYLVITDAAERESVPLSAWKEHAGGSHAWHALGPIRHGWDAVARIWHPTAHPYFCIGFCAC